ncbi:hypothetical protein DdX_13906 [Ditylenchus destructor]|uniref:Uncharacterized protein n=1 Tax=Ditylenchus destructor TaxID=166010 RepID=A0AAD4QW35_9BILA|nr:hypothetical protein DdX_13906 [Ditylenchus destructor]
MELNYREYGSSLWIVTSDECCDLVKLDADKDEWSEEMSSADYAEWKRVTVSTKRSTVESVASPDSRKQKRSLF